MIFITGVTGLIGSFICRKFLEEGHKIKALIRKDSDLSFIHDIKNDIELVEGSIFNLPVLENSLQNINTIIHAAAIVSYQKKYLPLMLKTNIEGTQNLVNTALNCKTPNFIHLSSVAAIGRSPQQLYIDETSKWTDSKYNLNYAHTKYQAELEVWRGQAEGLNTIILNPSVVLGPGNWNRSSTKLFKYIWKEKPFFTEGTINYVDVRDVANLTYLLHQQKNYNERYIINASNTSYKNLFALIAKNFNKREPSIKVNHTLTSIIGNLSEKISNLTNTEPLITKEISRLAKINFTYNNKKVINATNYAFKPLEETIKWSCEQLEKHYA